MGLHHMCTVCLYAGIYLVNLYHFGTIVAILHDVGDIFACITRVLGESYDKKLVGPVFAIMMVIWFYTRLLVYPYLLY